MKNILEVIKKAPKDHVYYCLINGDCYVEITNNEKYPITVRDINDTDWIGLTEKGKYFTDSELPGGECVLFPSRDNRDWEAFERELDGKPEEKKPLFHSESESFDGSVEMVSIPDRPMMAAVICAGLLARGSKDSAGVLANKAVHYADIILKHTEEESK